MTTIKVPHLSWVVYADGFVYGPFESIIEAEIWAKKELPVSFNTGVIKYAQFFRK